MRTITRIAIATSLAGLIAACSNDNSLYVPEIPDPERPIPVGELLDPDPVDVSMSYDPAPFPEPIVGPVEPSDVLETPPPMRIVAGYYDADVEMSRGYFPSVARIEAYTHFVIGFANIDADSRCALTPTAEAALVDVPAWKESMPGLKVLLGVRTWSPDKNVQSGFHGAALDPALRTQLAESCAKLVEDYDLDGINLAFPHVAGLVSVDDATKFEMEPVRGADYAELVATLDAALQADLEVGEGERLTTAAVPPGPIVGAWFSPSELSEVVDWIFLPAYDFDGDDDSVVRHVAPLHRSDANPSPDASVERPDHVVSAVQSYIQAGMPAWKIVLGVTFDGRMYQTASSSEEALYEPSLGFFGEDRGLLSWRQISATSSEGLVFLRDESAQAPYIFDPGYETPEGEEPAPYVVVSHEDVESVAAKRRYAVVEGLAGLGAWHPTADDPQSRLLRSFFER